jgi:hypothetical protein
LEKEEMYKIAIEHTSHEEQTRAPSGGSSWDNGDYFEHHEITGFKVVPDVEGNYFDFVTDKEVGKGDTLFLVHAFYNTGDSFTNYENKLIFLSLLETYEDAEHLVTVLYDNHHKSTNPNNINVIYPSGKYEAIYTGTWKGYFQSLRSFEILSLTCKTSVVHKLVKRVEGRKLGDIE